MVEHRLGVVNNYCWWRLLFLEQQPQQLLLTQRSPCARLRAMKSFDFAACLRRARTDKQMSAHALARRAKTCVATVQNIENGITDPRMRTYERLMRALGAQLRWERK